MSYKLKFKKTALKEWRKLDGNLRIQFKKKLEKRLQDPYVPSSRLSGTNNRFKIKLRNAGYRLVYEVRESEIVVVVIAVGKREKETIYKKAATR
jgi:mRNA interferase RelE/StbE